MSRLKRLLRVALPSTRNTQQTPETARRASPVLDLRCVHGLEKPSPPSNTLHTTNQVPVVTYGAMELHQQKALTMLHRDTSLCYAAVTNNLDIDPVTVTLGIREANGSIVTCDLLIPRAKYDPHLLSALLKQYGGTIQ